jgi:hypothetical protein
VVGHPNQGARPLQTPPPAGCQPRQRGVGCPLFRLPSPPATPASATIWPLSVPWRVCHRILLPAPGTVPGAATGGHWLRVFEAPPPANNSNSRHCGAILYFSYQEAEPHHRSTSTQSASTVTFSHRALSNPVLRITHDHPLTTNVDDPRSHLTALRIPATMANDEYDVSTTAVPPFEAP